MHAEAIDCDREMFEPHPLRAHTIPCCLNFIPLAFSRNNDIIKPRGEMMSTKYISSVLFKDQIETSSYLNELPVIKHLKEAGHLDFSSDVTFFVGENGTGKSTLLEAIAVAYGFNAEGGSRNFTFSSNETHSELYEHITLVKNNSQFIIATHSPILMAFPNAEILDFSPIGIKSVEYQDTEHFQITKRFLDNPEKMLHYLLNDTDI